MQTSVASASPINPLPRPLPPPSVAFASPINPLPRPLPPPSAV
jgi:hypothetical protein